MLIRVFVNSSIKLCNTGSHDGWFQIEKHISYIYSKKNWLALLICSSVINALKVWFWGFIMSFQQFLYYLHFPLHYTVTTHIALFGLWSYTSFVNHWSYFNLCFLLGIPSHTLQYVFWNLHAFPILKLLPV